MRLGGHQHCQSACPGFKMRGMTTHILALETSSSVCGVALLSATDGSIRYFHDQHDATAEHAERLLPMVDHVLEHAGITRNQLSAVAFGQGPGGFTGLRVACGVAQGIAFGLGLPVVPVDSLMAAATQSVVVQANATNSTRSLPCVRIVLQDARMNEIYAAVYRTDTTGQGWVTEQTPCLVAVDDMALWLGQCLTPELLAYAPLVSIVGDALTAYPQVLQQVSAFDAVVCGDTVRATASSVAWLAWLQWQRAMGVDPALAAPLYVRDKIAFTTKEREAGQGGNPRASLPGVIKPMTSQHLEHVVALENKVQAFPWTPGNFSDALAAGYPAWVMESNGVVEAFCIALFAPDIAQLLLIATDPDHQKKGVASRLLQHCMEQAKREGLPSIMLEVRVSNTQAQAFYHRHGFEQIAVRKGYYPAADGAREDACILQKSLS